MKHRALAPAALAALIAVSAPAPGQQPLAGVELSDMDRSADACTDFFEFANGAWRSANPIPPSMSRWSRRWAAGEASKDRLKQILEETSASTAWPKGSPEQQTGDFYSACMDAGERNRLGGKPIAPLLSEIAAMKGPVDLQKMIGKLHGLAINAPFATGAGSDNHEPNDVILQVAASGLGLPDRDYYLKPEPRFAEARTKYLAHIAKMLELAGEPAGKAAAAAETIFRMEKRLAGKSLDNVALRDPKATDHKMTFGELQALTPRFDWAAFAKEGGFPPGAVNVNEPVFMAEVNRQLGSTPLADWKTYLKWHVVRAAAASLSDAFVQEDFAFNGAYLKGEKEMKPAWKRCVESTDRQLGEALGREYVKRYFPPEAKARMQEMVRNLRTAMGQTVEGLEWMSPATKKRALEKLSTFNPKIGYPDKWKDYSQVAVSRASYWNDLLATRRFNVRDDDETIGKPVDRGRWGMTPPTSNAYYNQLLNEIVFPAGILQPPAFGMGSNDAVNYGAIGVVIGHEISHGFDDQGAQYDATGRLENWWSDEDLKKFQEKTACVAEQYEGYFIEPGIHHNGRLVLGEAIGDLAGARIAYRAFQIEQQGKPPLPDVDGFTPDQQFFIAWGQFRGDAIRPELARTMVQGDPHPVAKYRVIGPLSNLPEFQKAFACKAGSPMVAPAEKRCDVW